MIDRKEQRRIFWSTIAAMGIAVGAGLVLKQINPQNNHKGESEVEIREVPFEGNSKDLRKLEEESRIYKESRENEYGLEEKCDIEREAVTDERLEHTIEGISQRGLKLIKEFEGFSPTVYPDTGGLLTIGYGHLLKEGENFREISKCEAEILLRQDIKDAERAIKESVKVPLTQGQYDALVSLVYNWGEGNFKKSEALEKLNAGDYLGASEEMEEVVKSGGVVLRGLVRRRAEEKKLFLEGIKKQH